MIVANQREEEAILEGGKKLAHVLTKLTSAAKPGVRTIELDQMAEELILASGGKPSFKGYYSSKEETPYPSTICTSVNDEVVHAIPSDRKLQVGDIIGIDIGMWYNDLCTDTAVTIPIGNISDDLNKLLSVTNEALIAGIDSARPGNHIGDIGFATESVINPHGFGIVRNLVGHGVGRKVHEDPQIPNFGKKGAGEEIVEGMVLALEPMVTIGREELYLAPDGWAWITKDHKSAAHFEHTIIVTKGEPIIVTKRS